MIFGTNGRDTFQGEPGDDTYTGGKGRDSFIVGWHPGISYGQDVITDFEANGPKSDRLLIESEPDRITAHGKHDTLLEWGDPSSVTYSSALLLGVNHQDITSDDFVLII